MALNTQNVVWFDIAGKAEVYFPAFPTRLPVRHTDIVVDMIPAVEIVFALPEDCVVFPKPRCCKENSCSRCGGAHGIAPKDGGCYWGWLLY